MKRMASLHFRLALISVMLFAMIAGFGIFTLSLFSRYNELSSDIRGRWLPDTRVLGDLNNTTSDFRTAEGDTLLASGEAERAAVRRTIEQLGRSVAETQLKYQKIPHKLAEARIYAEFSRRWDSYRRIAVQVTGLAFSGNQTEATTLYRNESRRAYDDASDALGALTAVSVEQADEASARAARAYRSGRIAIIAAVLLAGTMLGAALFYIRNWISLPMTRLAHTMRLLAANRTNLEIEGTDRGDEIGDMSRAVQVFRSNAIELIQSQHGLAQQAGMLEQKLAYEKELTRLQRNFVSMISHEFRTPLTAIDAHAQRLNNMKEHIQPKDIEDRARRIRSAVQRITSLMDNLLNTSRLMDGKAELFFHPAEFDMVSVLRDVCTFHREISPSARIIESFGTEPMPFHGDQKLLFQTFSNLLSNAIKYSAEDIFVQVTARQDEDATVISFRDQGLGIPQKDLGILFDRYYRGSNVSGIVGTGIGLYLAKTVVDMHGGDISVISQEGHGSCFTISLPLGAWVQHGSVAKNFCARPIFSAIKVRSV